MRVTLTRSSSNGGSRAQTGYLPLQGKALSSETGTLTQPQHLWPTICSACKMCWGNQWRLKTCGHGQLMTGPTWDSCQERHSLSLILPGWQDSPETQYRTIHDWPKEKKKKKVDKMIPNAILPYSYLVHGPIVVREASFSNGWEQMQIPTNSNKWFLMTKAEHVIQVTWPGKENYCL